MTILVFGTVQPEALKELVEALRDAEVLTGKLDVVHADSVLDNLDPDMDSDDYDAELERRLRELVADKTVLAAVCGYQPGEYLLDAWELARAVSLAPRFYTANLNDSTGKHWLEYIDGDERDVLKLYLEFKA